MCIDVMRERRGAGPAAAAGPRAPPTASGAPATPCQRREQAAPRAAAAAAAAAPRRAITRPTPARRPTRDTDPRLPTPHSLYEPIQNSARILRYHKLNHRSPTATRARSAADRGAAEPPVCGLAAAQPLPPIHAPLAARRPPAPQPPDLRPVPLAPLHPAPAADAARRRLLLC
ncbi:unnamed protein product [Chilo suppressalis]|uniref:Uncharacterized protein n=1 Tax=Chilo suppressalis TaxID=168631 RepID=A0ABN8BFF1_CHISP|nr:unnamed protein product [Chilo suppressalis]